MGRNHDRWHGELEKITTSLDRLALDTDEEVRGVVLDRLRRPTDVFLRKRKKWCFRATSQEDQLNALIRGHSDKSVALLSCAHVLSRMTIRSLLATPIELNVDLASNASMSRYLGLIAALHFVNEKAVSRDEAKRAKALILLLEKKSSTFLRHMRSFFSATDTGLLYDIFPPGTLDTLLRQLWVSFATQIEVHREQCDWANAHRATGELSTVLGIYPMLDTFANNNLQSVRAWSRWQPVQRRIYGQEKLSLKHKAELLDVLVLNGPDFSYARHRTALDALLYQARRQNVDHIRHRRFFVRLSTDTRIDSRTFLDGILNFPCGVHLSMPGAVEFFTFLCLRNDVTLNTLRILEEAAALQVVAVYQSLSDLFYSSKVSARSVATMHLLMTVRASGNHALVTCLNDYARDIVNDDFHDAQMRLHDLLTLETRRNPQPTATQLQSLGQCITAVPELHRTLDTSTQLLLDDWPSSNEIRALFQLQGEVVSDQLANGLGSLLDQYCLVRLTGRGMLDEASRRSLTALLWHWEQRPHVPRRTLALSIISCPAVQIPLTVQTECLIRIQNMDDDHLRDLARIICSGTELACAHLARLMCSRRFLRLGNQRCWKEVLS